MRAPSTGCPASLQSSLHCQQGGSQETKLSCRAHRAARPCQSPCEVLGPASLQGLSMSLAWPTKGSGRSLPTRAFQCQTD